jgi:1-deoxyxylulose-5-phosphate synthase
MRRLVAAPSAGEYGNLLIADLPGIGADEGLVSREADGARLQHSQTLQHFFDNVFGAVHKLFHDAANLQRLRTDEKPVAGKSLGEHGKISPIGGRPMAHYSRRQFIKTGLAAGALASAGSLPLKAAQQKATDLVALGNSGVKVTRLAFGTGTMSGQVQRDLGQTEFTRLVRYAHERGIRFFETAESYAGMHQMLGIALKGVPRDSYQLMTKMTTHNGVDPQAKIDELRRMANTEYFDVALLHWQHTPSWPTDTQRWQDGIAEAQTKKVVLARGASVHGLPALRKTPDTRWLEVAMIRMNHKGVRMDAEDYDTNGLGNVNEVVEHVKQVRKEGMGVISMKLVGEGAFTAREDRQAAMKFAFRNAGVNAVTVGYKNTAEVDEAIENLNLALA